jgi:FixJ family two-component response regulator
VLEPNRWRIKEEVRLQETMKRSGKGLGKMHSAASGVFPDCPTLLVVDDEESILSLCRDLAANCGWSTKTASTTDEALRILEDIQIDCLVTDIRVPTGGLALIGKVRSMFPGLRIFVLSQYGDVKTTVQAIRLGALDFIAKPFVIQDFQNVLRLCAQSLQRLIAPEQARNRSINLLDASDIGVALYDSHHRCLAINDVLANGGFPPSPNSLTRNNEVVSSFDSDPEQSVELRNRAGASLTCRENETLKHLGEGKCNKEIAQALALSPKTVDTYRQRIMSKLGLHSHSDLIRYAIRNGLAKP